MSKKKSPGPVPLDLFKEDQIRIPLGPDEMAALKARCLACRACGLRNAAQQVVFGEGNILRPHVAFVGEAPGNTEDQHGRPFVGPAGKLLDDMIKAMGYDRAQVYICNTVNCRPPGNRKPDEKEIRACTDWLVAQLHGVQPQVIVALGATAANILAQPKKTVGDLRGIWFEWQRIPVRVTYHPAYLLRNPKEKAQTWLDMQAVLKRLAQDGLRDPESLPK